MPATKTEPTAPPAAKAPPAVKVSDRVFVVQADHLGSFTRDYIHGRHESTPSVSDLNPNDPRGTGYSGTLPQSRNRVAVEKLFRLFVEEGTFARVMDQVAEDSWSEGWTLSTKDEAWASSVKEIDERLDVRGALELADKWHLVAGVSLLYLNLDSATLDRWREPKGVTDVFHAKPVTRLRIKEARIETDPGNPRFDRANAWILVDAQGRDYTVHWQRVLEFRQFPKPDSDWEGVAVGGRIYDDVAYKRNVEWAAATAYGQRNSPLLVVKIKDGVKVTPEQIDAIEDETNLLQNHTVQKVIARNFDVVPITGSAALPDPMNFWLIAIRSLSVTTHIPSHILAGMAAGELSSSSEDTRRWHGYVSRRQENFCTRIIREWYGRLALWGLIKPLPKDFKVVWKPLGEPTAKETAEIESLRAGALQTYRNAGIMPPAKLVDYEGQDPLVSELEPIQRPNPFAPSAPEDDLEAVQERGRAEAEKMNLTPEEQIRVAGVRRVEQAVEDNVHNALQAFWQDWLPTLMGFLAKVGHEAAPAKPAASITVKLGRALEKAVLEAYETAARLGVEHATRVAGGTPKDVKAALDKSPASYFRTVSKLQGAAVAKRVTSRIRTTIADGLSKGEGVSLIRDRVQREWNDLARFESERIARTESMNAFNQGAKRGMEAAGITRFTWRAYPGADNGDPEGPCVSRDGRVFETSDEENYPPDHPNCVLPGQVVEGTMLGGLKAAYSGPALEFVTRSGRRLSVTPNHPVLTPNGFAAARTIKNGDHLVSHGVEVSLGGPAPSGTFESDHDEAPVVAEATYDALAKHGLRKLVPTSAEDLHGDALHGKGQVDVVRVAGQLRDGRESSTPQRGSESYLKGADSDSAFLPSGGGQRQLLNRADTSTDSSVGGPDLRAPGLRVHGAPLQCLRFGLAPEFDASQLEASRQSNPADAAHVADFLQAQAGQVAFDEVVEIRYFDFKGHVYDFQTPNSAYWCNGILIHNCRCLPEPFIDGFTRAEP